MIPRTALSVTPARSFNPKIEHRNNGTHSNESTPREIAEKRHEGMMKEKITIERLRDRKDIIKLMNTSRRPQKIIRAQGQKGSISHAKKEFERLKDSTEHNAVDYFFYDRDGNSSTAMRERHSKADRVPDLPTGRKGSGPRGKDAAVGNSFLRTGGLQNLVGQIGQMREPTEAQQWGQEYSLKAYKKSMPNPLYLPTVPRESQQVKNAAALDGRASERRSLGRMSKSPSKALKVSISDAAAPSDSSRNVTQFLS